MLHYIRRRWYDQRVTQGFNGHPPLGVNATRRNAMHPIGQEKHRFNGHPPLGVNATFLLWESGKVSLDQLSFNGHPPLGVNATGYRAFRA
jgi:hypothetical protein